MSQRRGVRLFWPIVLIGVGAILLLSNLGVIKGDPWAIIFQLWPVLLIALGLEILFGRSTGWGAVVSALLGLALVGSVLWFVIAQPRVPGLQINFGNANLQTQQIAYPLNDVSSASVSIDFGAGTNELHAPSAPNNLIDGTLQTYGPVDFSANASSGHANVEIKHSGVSAPIVFPNVSAEHWDIRLNPAVTYDFALNTGVGRATVDFGKLKVAGGSVNAGVGTTDLYLPNQGRFTMEINGGVGTLKIYLPSHMALHVEVNGGLGSFNPSPRLESVGPNTYETAGFSTADNAITLHVNAGVGTITIVDSE